MRNKEKKNENVMSKAEFKKRLAKSERRLELSRLWMSVVAKGDEMVSRFMNIDNGKNIDLKIKVLKERLAGKSPDEIDGYYKVVRLPGDNVYW